MSETANDVRKAVIRAIDEAHDHSDLLRRLMAIAYAPNDEMAQK